MSMLGILSLYIFFPFLFLIPPFFHISCSALSFFFCFLLSCCVLLVFPYPSFFTCYCLPLILSFYTFLIPFPFSLFVLLALLFTPGSNLYFYSSVFRFSSFLFFLCSLFLCVLDSFSPLYFSFFSFLISTFYGRQMATCLPTKRTKGSYSSDGKCQKEDEWRVRKDLSGNTLGLCMLVLALTD
jgi:hypothetical protein